MSASLLAFLPNTSGGELILLVFLGLLLFGRDLPAVGRKAGQVMAQFRRGLQDFKDQMDRDATISEMRQSVRDVKRAIDAPGAVARAANPRTMLENLTDETLSSELSGPLDQVQHTLPPAPPAPAEAAEPRREAEPA